MHSYIMELLSLLTVPKNTLHLSKAKLDQNFSLFSEKYSTALFSIKIILQSNVNMMTIVSIAVSYIRKMLRELILLACKVSVEKSAKSLMGVN